MNLLKNLTNITILTLIVNLTSCKAQYSDLEDGIYAEFITTKGIMVGKLSYKRTPVTVANFVSLAEGTNTLVDSAYLKKKYFDGLIFHRVIDKFMIQGGDPTGTGSGSPGYKFMDEFHPDLKHDKPGILSMANSGPKTNGSQFFITEKPTPHLDNKHSVFGELIIGLDVQDSISNVETTNGSKPSKDIVIEQLNIIRKGNDAIKFNAPEIFLNHFAEIEKSEKEKALKTKAILNANKEKFAIQKEKSVPLPSGLQYYITEKGTGEKLTRGAKVLVNYAVYFESGKLLETNKISIAEAQNAVNETRKSRNGYQPISCDTSPNAQMISGFKEGLQCLSVGDKATLFIPYHLAYGESGTKGVPGKTNLFFEVELIKLIK